MRELPVVTGASDAERQLLAALGGIARAIAGDRIEAWPDSVRQWASAAENPSEDLLDGVLTSLAAGHDPLATLYDASISPRNRRRLGTVFTPAHLVEHMTSYAAKELGSNIPHLIVDPGAGVGAFTISAARRWPSAHVAAVDVNPVTLGLLGARIAFELDAYPETARELQGIELRHGDFLTLLPKLVAETSGPALMLGNPPYTRVQELSSDARETATAMSSGVLDNGHANLAIHFQAAILRHLRPSDVSCLVLPGSFAYTRASRGLRSALWAMPRRIGVQRVPPRMRMFSGRSVQAAVLLVGHARKRRPPLEMESLTVSGIELRTIEMHRLRRTDPEPPNWFATDNAPPYAESDSLGSLAVVRRGVATGANRVFFLDDRQASRFPKHVCVAGVLNLAGVSAPDLDAEQHQALGGALGRRWLLAIPRDEHLAGELAAYVDQHTADVSSRYLPSHRSPWYSLRNLSRPQLLIAPLSRDGFKVVLNSAQAVPSNNLIGVSLRNGGKPERLATWLRSRPGQAEMRRLSRRYHGGSYKLEPGDVASIRVPLPICRSLTR